MKRIVFAIALLVAACPASLAPPTPADAGNAGGNGGAGGVGTGISSTSNASASSAAPSSSSTGAGGGSGGEGGELPPHPIDCSKLNPGFVCVEDDDCPEQDKPEIDQCGRWLCVVPLPLDAGAPGKCVLSSRP